MSIQFDARGPPEIAQEELTFNEVLGGGCYGQVFKGTCREKVVAIKRLFKQELTPKALEEFKKEVEICSQVYHPNVVLFMGACTQPGQLSIVSELLPKGNLQAALHDSKLRLSLYLRMKMAKDAAMGINWLHCSTPQIIHRDIKPSNLLIDENYRVKVCDFGLSAVKQHGEFLKDKDRIPGSPLWMAPEVMQGRPLNEKADVYSFGLVLWEIVTQSKLFPDMKQFPAFKRAICEQIVRPPLPTDILPSIRTLIENCWAPNPENRPHFNQIIQQLDNILVDVAIRSPQAAAFWSRSFTSRENVPWPEFEIKFSSTFNFAREFIEPANAVKWQSLKIIIAKQERDPSLIDPPFIVNIERFGRITQLFGLVDNDINLFFNKIVSLLQNEWFHGDISTAQSHSLLSNESEDCFLIRFSGSQLGFALSKKRNNKVSHLIINIIPTNEFVILITTREQTIECKGVTIGELLENIKTKIKLGHACSGWPYAWLFASPNPVQQSGYGATEIDFDDDE
eukprot:TRINITY_DN708_c5_g1_i1.p1 TRINITY_DN708_c5_g1~~TRINITY_DN708_c5_g1_i1.p1  ORF type:complete len:509 (+),score=213.98 TRINITY_DN708_c5_g1_i1:63-1589(+)